MNEADFDKLWKKAKKRGIRGVAQLSGIMLIAIAINQQIEAGKITEEKGLRILEGTLDRITEPKKSKEN